MTAEQMILSLPLGEPTFTYDPGDKTFDTAAPDGSASKWIARKVGSLSVPILFRDGTPSPMSLRGFVYRDVSPDGASYSIRLSLPTYGGKAYHSGITADVPGMLDLWKYRIVECAHRWLDTVKTGQTVTSATPSAPRLTKRTVKPETVLAHPAVGVIRTLADGVKAVLAADELTAEDIARDSIREYIIIQNLVFFYRIY